VLKARGLLVVALVAFPLLHAACIFTSDSEDEEVPATVKPPKCQNGRRDKGEDNIDCGGACGKCPGATCNSNQECGSGSCENKVCQAQPDAAAEVTSSDGIKDNGETDIDCGGPNAPPCAEGKGCESDNDCADKYCKADTKTCAVPRNDDGVKNGTETDVDCGGQSGKKCAEGLVCAADSDCNGACSYLQKCVDAKSCKPHFGGDTCGTKPMHPGEFGDTSAAATNESCCRSLPVPGYTDPKNPTKQVFVDKYEVTAGRVRAFIESLAAANGGEPNIKAWVAANEPAIWDPSWNLFMSSGTQADNVVVPRQPSNPAEAAPWNRNVGTNFLFGAPLYVYVHGHNCGNLAGSYGYPTFWYPDAIMTGRGEVARATGFNGAGGMIPAQEALDVKSMTCIPAAVLAAFCHWDGGQLATDEVLDFITNAPGTLGSTAGCGTRCAPTNQIQQTGDSGTDTGILYRFPYFDNAATHEGVSRIATPGRVFTDVVRINANDEPWMDLHGNVHEIVYDMTGATFTGKFAIKYRGIGQSSARAGGNSPTKFTFPEYKAAYSGGRCMRFK
jgi:hypothetical protein